MGGLIDRVTALEEAAARQEHVNVPAMSLEEATAIYMKVMRSPLPPPEDYVSPFEGVPPERHIEVYLRAIGARPVPK